MTPDCVRLARLGLENRRLIHNALAPLGWKIEDSPIDGIAAPCTPEGGIEILIIEAPPVSGRPIATPLPTLWLLPPATVIPQVAGEGPHDFIRLPAPCEVIVARCLSLVRATLRERALRRYEREAVAHVTRRRGQIATIAHQLASPLSAVIEYLELLSESPPEDLGPRQREMVTEARRAGRRIAEKVEELVDVTAAESGIAIDVSLARTELKPIIEEIQEWAVPMLRAKGQGLSIQLAPAVPAVCGDKERLCQALRYSIEHASRFAPTGGRIEIAAARDPERAGFARISVAEHDPQECARDRAKRAEIACDDEVGQDDLEAESGMALGSAIAAALGGLLQIANPTGCGMRIDISLPAWESRAARIAEAQALLAAPGWLQGGAWVCRASGKSGIEALGDRPPWVILSPGEVLAICDAPPEGMTPLGRVRDLRDSGSLARALQPMLEIHPMEPMREGDLRCTG